MEIKVLKDILENNEHCAQDNENFFLNNNVKALNIMGSPGCGKTSLIIETVKHLDNFNDIYVIEGDIESSIDSEKLVDMGIDTLQINTGGSCHLNANMIGNAIESMDIKNDSIMFVENVGNLVCTAAFDLGENFKIVILSVTEGHDKPYKYPLIFEKADAVILNKADLIPHINFSKESFYKGLRALNQESPVFEISCQDGSGVNNWVDWLKERCRNEKG